MFRDLNAGRLEGKKARGQAVICEQSSRKIHSLSWERVSEGQERVNRDSSLIPTPKSLPNKEGDNIASRFTLHTSLKQCSAFTLAEVLITLGIIGVVAAMTMPALIANYKNKEFAVRAKRTYSLISQAIKLYEAENEAYGDITGLFDTSKTSKEVLTNFSKYFDGAKLCLSPSKDCEMYAHNVLWASALYKPESGATADGTWKSNPLIVLKDGSFVSVQQFSKCIDTTTGDSYDSDGNLVVDKDGNPVTVTYTRNYCASVRFDTNGNSGPNQYGADAFELRIQADGKMVGWSKSGWNSLINILNGGDPIYTKYVEGQKND